MTLMRSVMRFLVLASFCFHFCPVLCAQGPAPSVLIGGTKLGIGMQVDVVVNKLQAEYQVSYQDAPSGTQVWVSVKGKSLPFAVLYVRGKSVVGIEHDILDREIESADDVFDALFRMSLKLTDEHKATCRVEAGSAYQPGPPLAINKASITMTCGQYRVVLLKNNFKTKEGESASGYIAREELGDTD